MGFSLWVAAAELADDKVKSRSPHFTLSSDGMAAGRRETAAQGMLKDVKISEWDGDTSPLISGVKLMWNHGALVTPAESKAHSRLPG